MTGEAFLRIAADADIQKYAVAGEMPIHEVAQRQVHDSPASGHWSDVTSPPVMTSNAKRIGLGVGDLRLRYAVSDPCDIPAWSASHPSLRPVAFDHTKRG